MTPERHARVTEVFVAALQRPEPERPSFVQAACAGDDDLEREVQSLLGHAAAQGLDAPIVPRSWLGSAMEQSQEELERERRALECFEALCDLSADERGLALARESDPELRRRVQALFAQQGEDTWEKVIADEAAVVLDGESPLASASIASGEEPLPSLLERLRRTRSGNERYRIEGEIARGGMGRILRVWDPAIRRPLAMKVMHRVPFASPEGLGAGLVRFLEEAQVTGQLDHPGIVPVHELGMDQNGRVFFTMSLVKGEDLSDIFVKARDSSDGWTVTRVLGVLLRVCETMAYAHSKEVVHRDLKPANIRVGRFGEVYVMDWGVARVLGRADVHDLRLRDPATASLHTERSHPTDADSGPLCTMDGRVVGTPHYMPIEQAEGRLGDMGPHSDVYAIGAMLYELLAGQRPYTRPGATVSAHTVLAAVLDHPPTPLRTLSPDQPPELLSICEKAMARDSVHRYRDTLELAADLRAYLEDRVVKAHAVGPIAELRKWIRRNRRTAALLAGSVLVTVGLSSLLAFRESRNRHHLEQLNQSLRAAKEESDENLQAFQRLADRNELDRLRAVARELWPAWPDRIENYRSWLQEAEALATQLPLHREFLAGLPAAPHDSANAGLPSRERWLPDLLGAFVGELADFVSGTSENGIADVRERLAAALEVEDRTYADHEDLWEEALTSLALDERFEDVEMEVQLGLVPLGPDSESTLWEFAVLGTGAIPERDATGTLLLEDESALVLVLLPPGEFFLGAQGDDPGAPQYEARPVYSAPMHRVALDAFFLGKFEVTQWQWRCITGRQPSFFPWKGQPPSSALSVPWKRLPVDQVDYFDASSGLRRRGLLLPTEAQWEYGCRAGSRTRWWCGDTPDSIPGNRAGNLFDQLGQSARGDATWGAALPWRDDHAELAPVGCYAANGFGLHDTIGNVIEWCRDGFGTYDLLHAPGDGLRQVLEEQPTHRIQRGGAFSSNAESALSSYRDLNTPDTANFNLGLRAARPLLRSTP